MRKVVAIAVLLSFGFTTHKLVKTKLNDNITVSIPAEFYPMTNEDIVQRYPSVRQPIGVFTDQDRVVDFSANISATQWPDANLEMASKFFKAGMQNLYDRIEFIDQGIKEVKRKQYIYFEFESRINGDRYELGSKEPILKYTYIQYLVEPGRTLVFAFNCPRTQREVWQETAHAIMESVRVK